MFSFLLPFPLQYIKFVLSSTFSYRKYFLTRAIKGIKDKNQQLRVQMHYNLSWCHVHAALQNQSVLQPHVILTHTISVVTRLHKCAEVFPWERNNSPSLSFCFRLLLLSVGKISSFFRMESEAVGLLMSISFFLFLNFEDYPNKLDPSLIYQFNLLKTQHFRKMSKKKLTKTKTIQNKHISICIYFYSI